MGSRILVVGLDGLSPLLVERWRGELPTLDRLMRTGVHGRLQSTLPAVTPPAWTAALTGVNPGRFGFWDFLVRAGHSYTDFRLVHSGDVQSNGVDRLFAAAGARVLRLSVPVSYPPPHLPGGAAVSCFFAPSPRQRITSPPSLQRELEAAVGPWILDAAGPNGTDAERQQLLDTIVAMDRQRFAAARHLLRTREWDLTFMVVMGTDRIAHYFFRDLDPEHPDFVADSPWRDAVLDRYRDCDRALGELCDAAGAAVVCVLSDHGTQRIAGKFHLNEWLIKRGDLALTQRPAGRCTPRDGAVDWTRTRAWASGSGGGIYLNVRGREPDGTIAPDRYDDEIASLTRDLLTLTTPAGRRLRTEVVERRHIYDGPAAAQAPDLFVTVEDLRWLVTDQIGHDTPFSERDFGRDGACHTPAGFFALAGDGIAPGPPYTHASLYDVAPTLLSLAGLPVPDEMEGHVLGAPAATALYDPQAETMSRLRALYLD